MADEAGDVPEPVLAWLAEVAGSSGLTEQELLGRLLSGDGQVGDGVEAPEETARLDELEAAVEALDAELDRKIEDVRERVVQLKLEGEEKAEADHAHPPMAARIDRLADRLDGLEGDLRSAADRLESVEERTEAGFANYEDVLEYLVDTTDDVQRRVATLAEATLDQRERLGRVAGAEARRSAADDLRGTAAAHGVTSAACGNCGDAVPLELLAAPQCPHCGVQFTELEPRRGLFRTSVLHAGQHPALEGEVAGESPALRALARERSAPAPSVRGVDAADEEDGGRRSAADEGTADHPAANDDDDTAPETTGEELTVVTGIGPAYAGRLRDAGVETVAELAMADPERLAADADIDLGRVERMVRRARDRVGGG